MRRKRTAARTRGRAPSASAGVPVRQLKDRISEYLQDVEAGKVVVVTNHGRAVADLVPHMEAGRDLKIRKATRPWGSVKLLRRGAGRSDSLSILLEERRRR